MDKTKILVVEDERLVAIDIKSILESEGFNVVGMVASGNEAIEKAIALKPDLILMDIFLRGPLSGIEAVKKIKETFDIPVIYLTAYEDRNTINNAKETNPVDYLVKPFEEEVLMETIKKALV